MTRSKGPTAGLFCRDVFLDNADKLRPMTSPPYSVDLRSDTLTLPSSGMRKACMKLRWGTMFTVRILQSMSYRTMRPLFLDKEALYSRQAAPIESAGAFCPL